MGGCIVYDIAVLLCGLVFYAELLDAVYTVLVQYEH